MNRFPCGWWIAPAAVLGLAMWLGLVGLVLADDLVINYTAPTERADSTPLAPEDISHYRVWVNDVVLPDTVPGTDTSVTLTLPPGDQTIYLTTVDTSGRESVPSEEKFVPGGAPNAPGQILIIVLP